MSSESEVLELTSRITEGTGTRSAHRDRGVKLCRDGLKRRCIQEGQTRDLIRRCRGVRTEAHVRGGPDTGGLRTILRRQYLVAVRLVRTRRQADNGATQTQRWSSRRGGRRCHRRRGHWHACRARWTCC